MFLVHIISRKTGGKDETAKFLQRNYGELFHPFEYDGIGTKLGQGRCQVFHWADSLKEIFHEFFKIPRELLWGTDAQKNELTKFKWADMPNYVELQQSGHIFRNEFLSVREFLQNFGTNVMRRIYSNVWIDWLINEIQSTKKLDLAIIADGRFPNECEAVNLVKGKNLLLTRGATNDSHTSETGYYDCIKSGFIDDTVNNVNLTIDETNKEVVGVLRKWGWI